MAPVLTCQGKQASPENLALLRPKTLNSDKGMDYQPRYGGEVDFMAAPTLQLGQYVHFSKPALRDPQRFLDLPQ